ncbi:MAG: siroheme synthase CysG [Arenicellales bacterium]|nr:siroheme synthase CysG [Arenicellales bacterium]
MPLTADSDEYWMDFFPVFLRLKDSPCVVVGGGGVAERKVDLLLRADARVTVVAPQLVDSLHTLCTAGTISWLQAQFQPGQLDNARMVIAATDDQAVNVAVSQAAQARQLPVNVVDQPSLCTFTVPSIVDRSPVVIAIGTGGTSPILGRLLRARLETLIPAAYGRLARLAGNFRGRVKAALNTSAKRRAFWEEVFQGPVAELVFANKDDQAAAALSQMITNAGDKSYARGEVYLVGAGPGDPDLLTFRALRLMQKADVVLYDRLVAPAIVDLVRRDAERIYVGKEKANHVIPQRDINCLLVGLAAAGKRVLRLKGGDPFIFGRGGEEIEGLMQENIPFQVIPGVTAAAGCACYAGIPLTHRDYAQSCIFVTGHLQNGSVDLNWDALCQPNQTIVVYMSLTGLEIICREAVTHGLAATTPAALIEQGTTTDQRVITATLNDLSTKVADAGVKAPTLLIIGEVVRLHHQLAWFAPGPPATGVATLAEHNSDGHNTDQ